MSLLSKDFVDVHQDFSYGSGWSRRWVNPPVCRFSCAIVHGSFGDLNFLRHFCKYFSWTSINILATEMVGPDGKIGLFSRVHGSFGDPNFLHHFCKNISWTSWKTLAMEPIGPNGFLTSFLLKFFVDIRHDLSYEYIHGSFGDPYFRRHFCQKFSWTSVKTLAMEMVGPDEQTGPFSRSVKPIHGSLADRDF
ncbi:hypothetical protein H5410_056552 [Solanum commersonii]|uniref:Uncharacterized protein n=1 Tax=Solanum commersonii TaxID=4109 RepID=A0A9J5WLM2_SOLCO|nr:hypothetical protein H5410_056552 [Solanum commersonii]